MARGVRYRSGCHDRSQSTQEAREQPADRSLRLSSDSHRLHPLKKIATCVLSASYVVVMPKKRQVLVEFEDVLGVGGRDLRAASDLFGGLCSFCELFYPLENTPPPGTRRTLGAPTVGLSLPSRTTSVTLPGTFFILSVTLVVLPRELRFFWKNGVQAMVEYPLLGNGCSLRCELTGVRVFKQRVSPEYLPCARCLHRAHGLLGGLVNKQPHVNR